jgi:transcriptional regulator with XRE-family HTH domain
MTTTSTATPQWTVGDRLRKARTWAGITVEAMAADIGRSDRTVRNYETDATTVPLLVLRQYAICCGVDVAWLTGELPDTGRVTIGYQFSAAEGFGLAA